MSETTIRKKPYHIPKLSELGNVKELTHTAPMPPPRTPDGGGFPNAYNS